MREIKEPPVTPEGFLDVKAYFAERASYAQQGYNRGDEEAKTWAHRFSSLVGMHSFLRDMTVEQVQPAIEALTEPSLRRNFLLSLESGLQNDKPEAELLRFVKQELKTLDVHPN